MLRVCVCVRERQFHIAACVCERDRDKVISRHIVYLNLSLCVRERK